MSNTPACRFGWDCQRPDCWFSHPSGRAIDGGGGASAVPSFPGALPSSAAGLPPHLQSSVLSPMSFNPSLLALHMQSLGLNPSNHSTSSPYPPVASSSVTKPITSSNLASSHDSYPPSSSLSSAAVTGKRGPQPCRYGRECHREECWFLHPEGRAIDEPGGGGGGGGGGGAGGPGGGVGGGGGRARRSSPGADEYDDALDEFEGKDGLTAEEEEEAAYRQAVSERGGEDADDDFVCPCCHGQPDGCTNTAACQAAGVCACQADRIEDGGGGEEERGSSRGSGRGSAGGRVVDDTWKDEWSVRASTTHPHRCGVCSLCGRSLHLCPCAARCAGFLRPCGVSAVRATCIGVKAS